MAFWFVLIALAFSFLWVITGSVATINATCLTLLGIGTTTALSAVAIENSRRGQCKTLGDVLQKDADEMLQMPVAELEAMIRSMQAEVAQKQAASNAPDADPAARDVLADTAALLADEAARIAAFRRRWRWLAAPWNIDWTYRFKLGLKDLLSENAGSSSYDFHRFQMIAWTLVLGFVFMVKVLSERAMPEFSTNLLLLMGISSGAYLGLKMATPRPGVPKDGDPPDGSAPASDPAKTP
jgi:uncharacterized small protein (DUF1192 family)